MENKKRFELSSSRKFGLVCLTVALASAVGLYKVCKAEDYQPRKEATYQTYAGEVRESKHYRKLTLRDEKQSDLCCIVAQDFDNNGRFDEIRLFDVPKGNALEQYTTLEKLEDAYQAIKK